MSRIGTQLLNGSIGFTLGYLLGSRLWDRRTGLVVGAMWATVSGLTSGRVYDRYDVESLLEEVDVAVESEPSPELA
jgi:hypothetical protein